MINITLKSWTSSSSLGANATFGFYFPINSYNAFLSLLRNKATIQVVLPNGIKYTQTLTPSFFKNCHEIRNSNIRDFFNTNNLSSWQKGNPHAFNATFDGNTLIIA